MKKFDSIVIGSGPAGLAAAYPLAEQGSVLVVESDLWGGTCPNRGCDPKKMLYAAVEVRQAAKRMQGHGIVGDTRIDWPAAMAFKRSYTSRIPEGTEKGLENSDITTVHGQARFEDARTIRVGEERYQADAFVIATGQRPRQLDIPGAQLLGTSTDFLDFDELPESIVFIGGGYISFELANIAAVAGSTVTLLQHNDRPLQAFPRELVEQLTEIMRGNGVDVRLNVEVRDVSVAGSADASETNAGRTVRVHTSEGDFEAGAVINATGRVPNIDGLNLAAAGVKTDEHGVIVDDHLRTSAAHISAIGDVVSRREPKLTPVAGFEGRYVADRIGRDRERAKTGTSAVSSASDESDVSAPIVYPTIPTIVFGAEKLAQIGVSVNEARRHPDEYTVESLDLTSWYTYNRVQDPQASMLLVKDSSGEVVGAATLSSVADEVINEFAAKLSGRSGPTISAYPTPASDMSYFR